MRLMAPDSLPNGQLINTMGTDKICLMLFKSTIKIEFLKFFLKKIPQKISFCDIKYRFQGTFYCPKSSKSVFVNYPLFTRSKLQ